MGKRHKNVYKVYIMGLEMPMREFLSAVDDNSLLWHKQVGHASFSIINKLISKDLVRVLQTRRFNEDQILELVHMWSQLDVLRP